MLMQCMHQRQIYKLFTSGWKEIFFNYDSDEETSGSESDKEFECEDITDKEEDTAKENKIRADCVADAVEPCSYIVLYSSPESFEMFFSAIL